MNVIGVYRKTLRVDQLKMLPTLQPMHTFIVIMIEWGLVLGSIFMFLYFEYRFLIPFLVFIIGSRMLTFGSSIQEVCCCFINDNRKMNDWRDCIYMVCSLFIDKVRFRQVHFLRHEYFQSKLDYKMNVFQYEFFQLLLEIVILTKIILKDFFKCYFLKFKIFIRRTFIDFFKIINRRIFYYRSLILLYTFMNVWRFLKLFCLLPYTTVCQLSNSIKLYTEQFNLEAKDLEINTRILSLSFWKSNFLALLGLNYYAEYYIYLNIPFYHLRKLHVHFMFDDKYENSVMLEKVF